MLADALNMHRRPTPGTASTYRVFVRDLELACSIGIYERERQVRQRVRVNVLLTVAQEAGDNIQAVLNYEAIVEGVRAIAGSGHIELVEVFANRVLDLCFEDGRVQSAWVSVEKLDVYPEANSVGAILERHRRGTPPVP